MSLDSHDTPTITFRRQALDHFVPLIETIGELRGFLIRTVHAFDTISDGVVSNLDFYLDPLLPSDPPPPQRGRVLKRSVVKRQNGVPEIVVKRKPRRTLSPTESDPFFRSCLLENMSTSDEPWSLEGEFAVLAPVLCFNASKEGHYAYFDDNFEARSATVFWDEGVAFALSSIFRSAQNTIIAAQIYKTLERILRMRVA